MKNQILTFILIVSWNKGISQSYHNAASFGYSYASGLLDSGSKTEKWFLQLSVPLKLKNKDYLILNSELHEQKLAFNTNDKYTCHKTNINVNYLHLREKRNTIGILNIGNNFQNAHFRYNTLQIGGGILFSKKQSKDLRWKYGLYVNREYFGLIIVPLLGIDRKFNSKLRLFGILPQNMRFEYKANKKYRSGIVFESPLNTYKMEASKRKYIDQRRIDLGVFQSFYLGKNTVLEITAKHSVSSKQKIYGNEQVYAFNILGEGFGGKRSDNEQASSEFRTRLAFDISLNYRIEVE